MEEILIALLQGVFEFTVEVLSYLPLDWPFGSRRFREPGYLGLACTFWFLGGGALAWVSVQLFPHTLLQVSAWRIANLILAPITSAFLAQAVARARRTRHPFLIPRNHFWQALWFTLGLTTVRFAYALRS